MTRAAADSAIRVSRGSHGAPNERSVMRRRAGVLAVALVVPALAAMAQTAAAAPSVPSPQPAKAITDRALATAAANTGAVRGGDGQAFQVVNVIVDRNGASHTRMHRTYKGLPVLGGDLVVHNDAAGGYQ